MSEKLYWLNWTFEEFEKNLTKEFFYNDLADFLTERVESERGGFAPVSKDDFIKFRNIIWLLVRLKWGPDADGDYPVSFNTWVRKHTRQIVTGLVPNKFDMTKDEAMDVMATIGGMIAALGDELRRFGQLLRIKE